jgi:hypothetical protein
LYMQYFVPLSLHRPLGRSVKLGVPRYCIYTLYLVMVQGVCWTFLNYLLG